MVMIMAMVIAVMNASVRSVGFMLVTDIWLRGVRKRSLRTYEVSEANEL